MVQNVTETFEASDTGAAAVAIAIAISSRQFAGRGYSIRARASPDINPGFDPDFNL